MKNTAYLCAAFLFLLTFFSCATGGSPGFLAGNAEPSVYLADRGTRSADRLAAFFASQNPAGDTARAGRLAQLYVAECAVEGVNSDAAFVQMCLETGFLRFGGLVTPDMNNFCGLGAIGPQQPGERFPSEQLGVRAHVQHLKAYGTSAPLVNACVDPRYKYVTPKGKAPTVYELSGTWASDPAYGNKLATLLSKLALF